MSGYEITWHTPGYIALIRLERTLSPSELVEYDAACVSYLERPVNAAVHLIIVVSEEFESPRLMQMTSLKSAKHPALGWVVIVGEMKPVTKALITIACNVTFSRSKFGYKFIYSLDSAVAFLYSVIPDLPSRDGKSAR